jgi:hypothetical protein
MFQEANKVFCSKALRRAVTSNLIRIRQRKKIGDRRVRADLRHSQCDLEKRLRHAPPAHPP